MARMPTYINVPSPIDTEDQTHSDGLMRLLAGILRNQPDRKIRIVESDIQRLVREEIVVSLIQSPTGSYVDISLVDKR